MATRQVNWTRRWRHLDCTGLTKSEITAKKAKFKAKGLVKIENQIKALQKTKELPKKATFTIKWAKERSRPFYFLVTYLTPPAKLVPIHSKGGRGGGHGGTGSQVSPTDPTGP